MPEKTAIALACILLLPGLLVSAFAQPAAGVLPPEAGPGGPTEAVAPTPVPKAEAKENLTNIVEVKDGLLSVEVTDTDFGTIMKEVARQTGIAVEIGGDVATRKVTTRFRDVDLERGIVRLLTLVKEKNYTIRYDLQGAMNKVEVYGSLTPGQAPPQPQRPAVQTRPQPQRPPVPVASPVPQRLPQPPVMPQPRQQPAVQKNPPPSRRILPPLREKGEGAKRQQPEAPVEPPVEMPEERFEDPVEMAPYVPPQMQLPPVQ